MPPARCSSQIVGDAKQYVAVAEVADLAPTADRTACELTADVYDIELEPPSSQIDVEEPHSLNAAVVEDAVRVSETVRTCH